MNFYISRNTISKAERVNLFFFFLVIMQCILTCHRGGSAISTAPVLVRICVARVEVQVQVHDLSKRGGASQEHQLPFHFARFKHAHFFCRFPRVCLFACTVLKIKPPFHVQAPLADCVYNIHTSSTFLLGGKQKIAARVFILSVI